MLIESEANKTLDLGKRDKDMTKKEIEIMRLIKRDIDEISKLDNYDSEKLLFSIHHLTSQLLYFYKKVAKGGHSDNCYYCLKRKPKEHQLVYVNLGRGFPKEIMDGHWCYVYKDFGNKLLVIPTTSIKEDSCYNVKYDLDITSIRNNEVIYSRLSGTDIRTVDIQRIDVRKQYINVLTERKIIEKFMKNVII